MKESLSGVTCVVILLGSAVGCGSGDSTSGSSPISPDAAPGKSAAPEPPKKAAQEIMPIATPKNTRNAIPVKTFELTPDGQQIYMTYAGSLLDPAHTDGKPCLYRWSWKDGSTKRLVLDSERENSPLRIWVPILRVSSNAHWRKSRRAGHSFLTPRKAGRCQRMAGKSQNSARFPKMAAVSFSSRDGTIPRTNATGQCRRITLGSSSITKPPQRKLARSRNSRTTSSFSRRSRAMGQPLQSSPPIRPSDWKATTINPNAGFSWSPPMGKHRSSFLLNCPTLLARASVSNVSWE